MQEIISSILELLGADVIRALKGVAALVSGGFIWELIKYSLPDLKKYFSARIQANKLLNSHIDPILKSSNELYGKLTSLAKEDFATFIKQSSDKDEAVRINKIYIYYLFAQFWARLELLKIQSDFISLSRTKKGRHLLSFITTYEARKNRILDRSIQRLIGESLLVETSKGYRILTLHEFTTRISEGDVKIISSVRYLDKSLHNTSDKNHRQKVLIFGVIICALIDYFDGEHHVVRRREIYVNKLTNESRQKIEKRIMGHYLVFLSNKSKYYRERKKPHGFTYLKKVIPFGFICIDILKKKIASGVLKINKLELKLKLPLKVK